MVLLKSKLTVTRVLILETRFLNLETFKNQVLRLENRFASFENQESR